MSIWHDVDPKRITPTDFLACIEISKGSKNKYELDKESGSLILDRVLYTSTHYPANYGFIPLTYSEDNDPLDVLVLCSEPIVPLALVRCYPIGVMMMQDSGLQNHRDSLQRSDLEYVQGNRGIARSHYGRNVALLQSVQTTRRKADHRLPSKKQRICGTYHQG